MYRATRFSGNRPKFFAIECNEPFSQYLRLLARDQYRAYPQSGGMVL